MTIKELMDMTDDYSDYQAQTEIYINGKPVDDISFGIMLSDNRLIVNLESYDTDPD